MTTTGISVSVNRMTGVGRDRSLRPTVVDLAQLDEPELRHLWDGLSAQGKHDDLLGIALSMKNALRTGTDVLPKIAQMSDSEFAATWNSEPSEERWKAVKAMKRLMNGRSSMPGASFEDMSDILS
jgi:hypothetical protein